MQKNISDNIKTVTKKTTLFFSVAILVVFLSSTVLSLKTKAVGPNTFISGYAWSENIGWIELQPQKGGVSIDANGDFLGYAWSENIGWIKFGGLTGFPTGPGTTASNAKISGSNIVGWARACSGMYITVVNQTDPNNSCSGTSRTDGYDGWISLDGTNYGVDINNTTSLLSGFAWGSDVLGWIDFSPSISSSISIIDFYAFPPEVYKNTETKLTWKTAGAVSCFMIKQGVSGQWIPQSSTATSGTKVPSGVINVPTTFTISCSNLIGDVIQVPLVVGIKIKPKILNVVDSEKIVWDAGEATGCSITDSDGNIIVQNADVAGEIVWSDITEGDVFTLSCTGAEAGSISSAPFSTSGSGSAAECKITQPIDPKNPNDPNYYVNRKTTFQMIGATEVIWTFKNNVGETQISNNPATKIFTTVGSTTITATGKIGTDNTSCGPIPIIMKLDKGTAGEQ